MRVMRQLSINSEDYRNTKILIAVSAFSIGVIVGLGLATFIMIYESGNL
jgi:hypothetical protein